ncbi:MAG: glycoside hydrolase family 3 N-terminal domain-containing protein [bacterium]
MIFILMKKLLKAIGYVLLTLLALILISVIWVYFARTSAEKKANAKAGPPSVNLDAGDYTFRDLNRNGALDFYEDARLPADVRVEDLLRQMTIAEKAGLMMHTFIAFDVNEKGELPDVLDPMISLSPAAALYQKHINFFNLFAVANSAGCARFTNALQRLAERTRLGIPITFSSDPRHGAMQMNNVTISYMQGVSHWCEPLGFGAIDDSALVATFGRMAAKEYRAMGIHTALHPMADLATEPRWARISGTFGEDATMAARLTVAYLRGFQGDSLSASSVSCMVKHFPGGGPQDDGWDPHFRFGKDQVYPGKNLKNHLIPFKAAQEAGMAQIMPYYGVPVGLDGVEEVAFGFNKQIVGDLLQDSLGYQGIVCSDWGLISPVKMFGQTIMEARDYGVESLTPAQKIKRAMDAGIDQFGGESVPELIVELVKNGEVAEGRIDISARKLLKLKFQLGLFDNPFVDEQRAADICSDATHADLGYQSQLRSQVLLKNAAVQGKPLLPLANGAKVFIQGFDAGVAGKFGQIVDQLNAAEVAILRVSVPFEPKEGFLERFFHQGRVNFTSEELRPLLAVMQAKPTVVSIFLERGVVMPEINEAATAIVANFGASDEAIFDVIFGKSQPMGKLPFELPRSPEAVERQKEDVPHDSEDPLFPYGFGLSYAR